MSSGIQQTVEEALKNLAASVGSGNFGEGDDFNADEFWGAIMDDVVRVSR